MNKDYHNKFASDIWCIFRGFQFSQNQVTKISRPELCTHVTFIHRILLNLFVVMIVWTLAVVEESSGLTAELTRATPVKVENIWIR